MPAAYRASQQAEQHRSAKAVQDVRKACGKEELFGYKKHADDRAKYNDRTEYLA